jgi:hypothetical protein
MGGTAVQPALTNTRLRDHRDKYVNVSSAVAGGRLPPEARRLAEVPIAKSSPRIGTVLRSDVYDELLKLPLRYKLHPFEKLVETRESAVSGYGLPLGPVDLDDTIPFHVHRHHSGHFYINAHSINARNLNPTKVLHINLVEGDLHRLDDELIKIFPLKKIFIKDHKLMMYNSAEDVKEILDHWFLGLGF